MSMCMFYFTMFNVEYFSRFLFEVCENFKGCAVDKLLNGFQGYFTRAVYFWKAKVCFEATALSNKTEGVLKFSHFVDVVETGLFFFFRNSDLLNTKSFRLNELNIRDMNSPLQAAWILNFKNYYFYFWNFYFKFIYVFMYLITLLIHF